MDDPNQTVPPEEEGPNVEDLMNQNLTLGFFLKGLNGPPGPPGPEGTEGTEGIPGAPGT